MIFVFKYNRESGITLSLGTFEDSQMEIAQLTRFEAELAARNDVPKAEIVVLSAATEDDLRRSHSKYFGDDAIRANIRRNIA